MTYISKDLENELVFFSNNFVLKFGFKLATTKSLKSLHFLVQSDSEDGNFDKCLFFMFESEHLNRKCLVFNLLKEGEILL